MGVDIGGGKCIVIAEIARLSLGLSKFVDERVFQRILPDIDKGGKCVFECGDIHPRRSAGRGVDDDLYPRQSPESALI